MFFVQLNAKIQKLKARHREQNDMSLLIKLDWRYLETQREEIYLTSLIKLKY
jgi:hypothetical protein